MLNYRFKKPYVFVLTPLAYTETVIETLGEKYNVGIKKRTISYYSKCTNKSICIGFHDFMQERSIDVFLEIGTSFNYPVDNIETSLEPQYYDIWSNNETLKKIEDGYLERMMILLDKLLYFDEKYI